MTDFVDLSENRLVDPFEIKVSYNRMSMISKQENKPIKISKPEVMLSANIGAIHLNLNEESIETIEKYSKCLKDSSNEEFLFEKYVLTNLTNQTIAFGQYQTEERIVLHPKQTKSYSWKFIDKENVCFFLFHLFFQINIF